MAIPFALPRKERFQMSGDNSVNGVLLRLARLVDGIGGHEVAAVARRRANPDRRVSATSVVTAPKSPAERRQHAAIVGVFADCRPALAWYFVRGLAHRQDHAEPHAGVTWSR